MRVAVVGGGIVGLSTARVLATRGHRTTLYEQYPLFHSRGSSHGKSRIVRKAYPDGFYTEVMAEAYPLWAELERESGRELLVECGLAYFGAATAPRVIAVREALEDLEVPHQIHEGTLGPIELHAGEIAIFTQEAGWVQADQAMQATFDLAVSRGLEVKAPARVNPQELASAYDAVVLATGPWIREFVDVTVRPTLQTFAYVAAQVEGPVWIDDRNLTYGFPSTAEGQKIGAHVPGPDLDPTVDQRAPYEPHLEQIRDTVRRHFRNPRPELSEVATCIYTNTEDEDFRIGQLAPNVFFVSACSGHAFKMGPWLGRLMANIATGRERINRYPRFMCGDE